MLTTTAIGAYPKPESVAVETWFGERTRRPSDGYEAALARMGTEADEVMDAAVAELERAHEINKEETGVLLALGEVYLMRGDPTGARKSLELMVRTNPQADEAYYILAYVAWLEGDRAGSRELLQKAHDARREEWKPSGAVAEGEVAQQMHTEASPLLPYFEAWDGTRDPDQAFSSLKRHLTGAD